MTHAIHDFSAKLRQPSVAPTLAAHVQWQKDHRRAAADGANSPRSTPTTSATLRRKAVTRSG